MGVLSTDKTDTGIAPTDPWEAVTVPPDPSTNEPGGIYYWNTKTNATTAIGEAKPTTTNNNNTNSLMQPPPQAGPMAAASNNTSNSGGGGLMDVVKEGMAFGVGSAIAHNAVRAVTGSLFGGGDDDYDDDYNDDDGSEY